MVRREFLRKQLYTILDSIKDVPNIKVWKPNITKELYSFADLGEDTNVMKIENSNSFDCFETEFQVVISFKIKKDLLETGELVNLSDKYLDKLQIAFNNTNIDLYDANENYIVNIDYIHIDRIISMTSENIDNGIIAIIGKIKNNQTWLQ